MALKDWKKTEGKDIWFKKEIFQTLSIEYYNMLLYPYRVYVKNKIGYFKDKIFKTKQAALKFAKAYMRKH